MMLLSQVRKMPKSTAGQRYPLIQGSRAEYGSLGHMCCEFRHQKLRSMGLPPGGESTCRRGRRGA